MRAYLSILEERAIIEDVNLKKFIVDLKWNRLQKKY
jgi:hypothetical protein